MIFALTYFASVEVKNSDFTHSLLVSQALLEHQTVRLDAYKDKVDLAHHFDYNYRIEKVNGHYYYFHSIGTPLLSLPLVKVANLLGKDMAALEDEYALLRFMAAITCILIFVVIYQICRCYLEVEPSLVISLVSVLGSTLISTLGIGLWNMNLAVLFIALSLLFVVRYDSGQANKISPFWLGFSLFLAYLCRPTSAIPIVIIFAYVFLKHRVVFLKLVGVFSVLFLLFVGWSWLTYEQVLPNYYLLPVNKSDHPIIFGQALYGHLLSPARGVFIFSPFFIVVIGGSLWLYDKVIKRPLLWLSITWFCLQVLALSTWRAWWGGHSYGPRLLTDAIPALILTTVLLWQEARWYKRRAVKTVLVGSYIALGMVGVFINTGQGLYNPSTYLWNKDPNVDRYPEYLFDWKYPQFLATESSLRQRRLEHQQAHLGPYPLGNSLTFNSREAVFWNWYEPETGWRWTQGPASWLVFRLNNHLIDPAKQYALEILSAARQNQNIRVTVNGVKVGDLQLKAFTGAIPQPQKLTFGGSLLKEGELNQIRFDRSAVTEGKDEDAPTSGMAFVWLKIYPFFGNSEGVNFFDSQAFIAGFSQMEQNWRWTDGPEAILNYPLGPVNPDQEYVLELTSGALDVQEVEVWLNGAKTGSLIFKGFEPQTQTLLLKGNLLRANDNNRVQLLIPAAYTPEGDSRRLGLAFRSLKIHHLQ
jgi:hypothetical protein